MENRQTIDGQDTVKRWTTDNQCMDNTQKKRWTTDSQQMENRGTDRQNMDKRHTIDGQQRVIRWTHTDNSWTTDR